jgi:hypothetical protein
MNSSAMRHHGALAAPTTRTEGTARDWAGACAPPPPGGGPEADAARLTRLTLPELRELRRVSGREEAELSYVRRMLHGRIDILAAEIRSRKGPGTPHAQEAGRPRETPTPPSTPPALKAPASAPAAPPARSAPPAVPGPGDADVVARLAGILRDGPARHRSSVRHLSLVTPDGEEAERLAGTMLQEVSLSDLAARTDEELSRGRARLLAYEADISRRRLALQRTADGCGAEIARRYREGEAQVDDLLP